MDKLATVCYSMDQRSRLQEEVLRLTRPLVQLPMLLLAGLRKEVQAELENLTQEPLPCSRLCRTVVVWPLRAHTVLGELLFGPSRARRNWCFNCHPLSIADNSKLYFDSITNVPLVKKILRHPNHDAHR